MIDLWHIFERTEKMRLSNMSALWDVLRLKLQLFDTCMLKLVIRKPTDLPRTRAEVAPEPSPD
jgi:hypothetical protein